MARDNDEQDRWTARKGSSDQAGAPISPEPDSQEPDDSATDVPIGLPISEEEYERLKKDAATRRTSRHPGAQQDPGLKPDLKPDLKPRLKPKGG